MDEIHLHFQRHDPTIFAWMTKLGPLEPIKKDSPANYFFRLCREIVCQQLSDKAGRAILDRFEQLFTGKTVAAETILALSHEQLRAAGMSNAKASYLHNLAAHVSQKKVELSQFDTMSDDEIVAALTQVKGIGPWTAEMFLMFTLGRQSVFSFGDLGLKKGLMKVYGFATDPTKAQITELIAKWSPYKSYASRILWASLDNR